MYQNIKKIVRLTLSAADDENFDALLGGEKFANVEFLETQNF